MSDRNAEVDRYTAIPNEPELVAYDDKLLSRIRFSQDGYLEMPKDYTAHPLFKQVIYSNVGD